MDCVNRVERLLVGQGWRVVVAAGVYPLLSPGMRYEAVHSYSPIPRCRDSTSSTVSSRKRIHLVSGTRNTHVFSPSTQPSTGAGMVAVTTSPAALSRMSVVGTLWMVPSFTENLIFWHTPRKIERVRGSTERTRRGSSTLIYFNDTLLYPMV